MVQNHWTIMQDLLFWICLLLSFVSKCHGQRIECTWGYEYLCGDKCLGLEHLCLCGNESITYDDTANYNCCNNGTCFKDSVAFPEEIEAYVLC